MSRVDDLQAEIYDLEDAYVCLRVDLENADARVDEIKDQIYRVRRDIAAARKDIILIKGKKNG